MNETHLPVSASLRMCIFIAAALILCNYYYLYFVPFTQGVAETSPLYSLFKIAGIIAVTLVLMTRTLRRFFTFEEMVLLIFLILATLGFFYRRALLGDRDNMFFNTVMCLLPFLILKPNPNPYFVSTFLECCLLIVSLQVIGDTFIYLTDASIWDNRAFIGGLGNPSSFGVTCNLLIAYILFERRLVLSTAFYMLALAVGVYMTSSLLSIAMFCLLTIGWCIQRLTLKNSLALVIVCSAIIALGRDFLPSHVAYKLKSAESLIMGATNDDHSSRSVSLRREIHELYIEHFSESPLQTLTIGMLDHPYMKFDSQILTYFSSFGILTGLLFFIFIIFILMRTIEKRMLFPAICILIFSVTFLTNRIMDYYPMPIFLALSLISIRTQKAPPSNSKLSH